MVTHLISDQETVCGLFTLQPFDGQDITTDIGECDCVCCLEATRAKINKRLMKVKGNSVTLTEADIMMVAQIVTETINKTKGVQV